ncbi:MAG: hypothetical protein SAJ12_03310 [Jaaginema sp. PMC 1079.18]|nr:hypothetical protein [Jaaginema sp. PMC 1080.18]MEC4850016.1 hypothetical protein [Jaaginema sp. PMC 1079.18]MEC4867454.1 hypothetical protein [Jaaginema sp. PMC 1078.18]
MDIQNIELEELEAEFNHYIAQEFRNFFSDNPTIRREALDEIFSYVYHQGDLHYKVNLVVPFLIRQVDLETDTDVLCDILCCIAAIATFHNLSDFYRLNTSTNESHQKYQAWVNSVRQPIYKSLDCYVGFLEHNTSDIRIVAADILAACKPHSTKVCAKFYDRLTQEAEAKIRASLLLLLAILDQENPLDRDFCEQILQSDRADIVKLAAAIALMYVAGEQPSQEVLDKLIKLGDRPNILLQLSNHFDDCYSDGHGLFANFFARLDDSALEQLMPVLIYRWACIEYYYYCDLLFEIIVFPEGMMKPGTRVSDLTKSQQFLLQAIADDDEAWERGFNISNLDYSLKVIGIQEEPQRDTLIRFLNGEAL